MFTNSPVIDVREAMEIAGQTVTLVTSTYFEAWSQGACQIRLSQSHKVAVARSFLYIAVATKKSTL